MDLASHITHSNVYAPYIAYYRSNGIHQLFRKLKPKPKLNPPNAHRTQIKICVSNVPNVPNAFRILKPIQKSSKRIWVFRNTGANAFAKNQMRLAYEDKRDLYCTSGFNIPFPRTTKKWRTTKFIRLLPYFTCCWEDSFGVKFILGCLWGHICIKCLWVLLTNVYMYWFRATGEYICGFGRPSNLVVSDSWISGSIKC